MFGRRTKAKAAGKAARGTGKATRGAGKALLKSGIARRAVRTTARVGAKGAGKTARGAGKVALKSATARRAAGRGAGKAALKGGTRALGPREPIRRRFLKYGLFALVGFVVGALVARSREEREVSSPFTGGTWGTTGTPARTPDAVSDPAAPHQRPEDPNRTGAEREYSDPSSGPLIGRRHQPTVDIPEQQQEVEQRIRTRIGEDPRTADMPHVNVEVNDGVAELRGPAPSEAAKEAAGEIAAQTEGVREVRNLITVS